MSRRERIWSELENKIAPEVYQAPRTSGDPESQAVWPNMHHRIVTYLAHTVIGNPWSNHLALIALVMLARNRDVSTVTTILTGLHCRFKELFAALEISTMEEWNADKYVRAYLLGEIRPGDTQRKRTRFWTNVRFSPHDIRHLFISEFLLILRQECGMGTTQFDSERYLRERDGFARTIMGWRSSRTIDIYDHTRDGERTLQVLATYQQDLSKRRYVAECSSMKEQSSMDREVAASAGYPVSSHQSRETGQGGETIWLHDAETMAWVNKLQQLKNEEGRDGKGI